MGVPIPEPLPPGFDDWKLQNREDDERWVFYEDGSDFYPDDFCERCGCVWEDCDCDDTPEPLWDETWSEVQRMVKEYFEKLDDAGVSTGSEKGATDDQET